MARPEDGSSTNVNEVDLQDPAERLRFYEALIAKGAPQVREERLAALRHGLIDKDGRAIDRSTLLNADSRLSLEQ